MKAQIDLNKTEHNFGKTNLVTVKGGGDNYACPCGLKGYRMPFQNMLSVTGKAELIARCPLAPPLVVSTAKKIRITNFTGHSTGFANLTNGSEHDVVACPDDQKKKFGNDIWVMGVEEPVRLLSGEYIEI